MPIHLQIEAKLRMIRLLWKVAPCSPQIRQLNKELIALYCLLARESKYKDQIDIWS
jgi:hypothetical protein